MDNLQMSHDMPGKITRNQNKTNDLALVCINPNSNPSYEYY